MNLLFYETEYEIGRNIISHNQFIEFEVIINLNNYLSIGRVIEIKGLLDALLYDLNILFLQRNLWRL